MSPPVVTLPGLETPPWVGAQLGPVSGRGVTVGIVDSGLDPALRGPDVEPGVSLVAAGEVDDRIGHGSACASIVRGMAPGATIVPIRVFDDRLKTSVEVLVAAIRWAVDRGLRVLNLSLGSVREDALKPLYVACEEARRRGTIPVAATAVGGTSYPAVFECAIGVKGDYFDNVYDFEFRPGAAVECVAQSRRRVRALGGEHRRVDSFSFAAPHVAAIVALLLERHPDADLDEIRQHLDRCSITRRRGPQERLHDSAFDHPDADGAQP